MTIPPLLAIAEGRRARPRKFALPTQGELRLHLGAVGVWRRLGHPDWLCWHTPNGEIRDARAASKLKAMGVKRGIPDLLLLSPAGALHCLELKAARGRLSDDQEAVQAFCISAGVPFVVAHSIVEVLTAFDAWGCLRIKLAGKRG